MGPRRFVYLIRSLRAPRHYVGLTGNVEERLAVHNRGESPHTNRYRPWQLLVTVEFAADREAIAFERYLKSGSERRFSNVTSCRWCPPTDGKARTNLLSSRIVISVSSVSMRFGSKVLFEDVTTTFSPGRRYGLTGPNGAGKSTFMKLLTGELPPQQGTVVAAATSSASSGRTSSPSTRSASSTR